ncbi:MAG: hypothetical protein INR68_05535 [Methylobacterium mesophilicum]|nr:hypothetical protein [Methylobacterium mesophilicum]
MVDPSEKETAAIGHAMRMLAEVLDEIGWETRLNELSEAQVRTIVDVTVTAFRERMRESQREAPF